MAGINVDPQNPGFKNVILKPHFVEELTYVKASYNSPYGLIKSAWERVGDKVIYKVTVPPGATATLHLEGENTPKELIAGTYKFEVNNYGYERHLFKSIICVCLAVSRFV